MAWYPNTSDGRNPYIAYTDKIVKGGKANTITSTDGAIKRNAFGTFIDKDDTGYSGTGFRNYWHPTSSYLIDDMVVVSMSYAQTDAQGYVWSASAGTWICISNVPTDWVSGDRANINAAEITQATRDAWLRVTSSNYYPTGSSIYWTSIGSPGEGGTTVIIESLPVWLP